MSQSFPLPPKNKIRVAYDISEAGLWRHRSVVIDLFRFSNTVCALLKSGRRDVRVYSSPAHAIAVGKVEKKSDLFSEIDLGPDVVRYDNSPYTALYSSDSSRPALVVTNSGSPAVMSLAFSKEILIGCFANASALAAYCRANPMPTLIVPACLYYDRAHVEDFICARSLAEEIEGKDSFPGALEEIHKSGRIMDFMALRPETGKRDIEIVLKKDAMNVLPRVKIMEAYGVVENAALALKS
ncbi:MAG: 2-phosphosulfolactate phosphatase [Elusimicrobia bacterium]|nr:2-phosphosulfolactate phosphatase [Elusimicrobiota bacterium]